eukprot:CAMPEP_0184299822 /NCGR_PEP_ID=MMETSP1049-20130417/10362_1 /TAXON_ID=77928 /ORGANISM="Proteomonas sulcata, Strain CCMP704" /LENGTH=30 /DNA_ID= /DNA_START= /DNA_END= /DNA_ORIENTATION=
MAGMGGQMGMPGMQPAMMPQQGYPPQGYPQ